MDEAWKLFEGTGKVTDYLNYCKNRSFEERMEQAKREEDTDGLKDGGLEKERETGWDRMLY